jgi:drug/metabolite transporter (DMT)-like permease
MTLGRAVAVVGAAFCLTLAIIVVRELSSEALAVAIGVMCGVAAGMPASVLLYVVLSRRSRRGEGSQEHGQQGEYPPVIIVQGQAPPALAQDPWLPPLEEARPQGQVRLVGGEDLLPEDQDNRG